MEEVPPPKPFENLLFAILGAITAVIVGVGIYSQDHRVNRKISSVPDERPRKPAAREEIEKFERDQDPDRLIEFYRGVNNITITHEPKGRF